MGRTTLPRTITFGAGLALGLGALATSRPCAASERCPVVIDGEASAAWQQARSELEASALPTMGDCVLLTLRLSSDDDAELSVRTRDGRHAERPLREPADLLPTAAALLITTDAAAPAAPAAPSPPVPAPREQSERHPVRAPAREILIFGLQGGVRYGAQDFTSPVMNGFASLDIRRWEVGITGGVDFGKTDTEVRPSPSGLQRTTSSAVLAGVFLGRREPAGPMQLFVGTRGTVAFVSGQREVIVNRVREVEEVSTRGEVRLGAYMGASIPRRSPVRVRSELGFEIVPADIDDNRTPLNPSLTPWWAVCVQLGVEFSR